MEQKHLHRHHHDGDDISFSSGAKPLEDKDKDSEDVSMPMMNESWLGHPVEDVDPLIFEDTFCVITKRDDRNIIFRFSCSKSLFLMGPLNPVRKMAIYITTHRWFENLITLTVLCNCVTLAMMTNAYIPARKEIPGSKDTRVIPEYDYYTDRIELGFLAIYTLEMVLKIIAKGLILNKYSYLRNRWNLLDLIVVASGFVSTIDDLDKFYSEVVPEDLEQNELEFIRTFRVLRAIKTISLFPGIKVMINALASSAVHLLEVMTLILMALLVFCLFGLELFQGALSHKCVIDKGGPEDPNKLINEKLETIENPDERNRLWTEWVSDWKNWKRRQFPQDEPTQCGNDTYARHCPAGHTCLANLGSNPDYGWTSFDNFFSSMLTTFQLITSDYWERVYDVVVSSVGIWSLIFFIIVIFMGFYCLLYLLLAVVTMSYENEAQRQNRPGKLTPMQRLDMHRAASTFSFDELSKLNICKMTNYRKRTKSEKENLARKIKDKLLGEKRSEEGDGVHLDDAILNLLGIRMTLFGDGDMDKRSTKTVSVPTVSGNHPRPEEGNVARKSKRPSNGERQRRSANDALVIDAPGSDVEVDMSVSQSQQTLLRSLPSSATAIRSRISSFLKRRLKPIVSHRYFEITIAIFIIANTICLAMEHNGQSKQFTEILRLSNHAFMAVFTAECVIKVLALQDEYLRNNWNKFDLIIVTMSYCDLAVSRAKKGSRGLSVIRSVRLLRVFKLANSWITMKVLLNIIFSSFADLGNLVFLLMIVIYIFAVMGMQVIGDHYTPAAFPDGFPSWHWKNFWYAFMMVFRILCGEWIEPMWQCLKAQKHYVETHSDSIEYLEYFKCFGIYLPVLIVGNFIFFNLFLALLLNSFDTEELNAQREKELEASGRAENLKNIVSIMMLQKEKEEEEENEEAEQNNETECKEPEPGPSVKAPVNEVNIVVPPTPSKVHSCHSHLHDTPARRRWKKLIKRVILQDRIEATKRAIARSENKMRHKNMTNKLFLKNPGLKNLLQSFQHDITPESSNVSDELSIARDCFPPKIWMSRFCPCRRGLIPKRKGLMRLNIWDKIRAWSVVIVGHPIFEYFILFLILASSITLCFEDVHLDRNQQLHYILCNLNYCFTAIFVTEMILKWLAIGVWNYFTSFWTLLDGFIVGVNLISFYFDFTLNSCSVDSARSQAASNLDALKALRTLRALRPLRAISRWQGMKIVVNALVHAIPAIFNVFLVCLLFWLIFSIMGVQFFKGQFYRCVDEEGDLLDAILAPNKDVCCAKSETHSYTWINTISNYDNVFEAYLSLFQVATFEGWIELMMYSVDAVGVERQPITDYQIGYYAFYVVFIIFGAFFALQLFIGVIIDNFNMLKKKYDGSMLEMLLTPTQRNFYVAMKNLGKKQPRKVIGKPKLKLFSFFYYVALSRKLEILIFIMIFLNMAVEAFEHVDSGQLMGGALTACKAIFTTVYILEALIKILGLGFFYFTIPWNVYDFILVLASLMDIFLTSDLSVTMPVPPPMLRVVRVFRIGRVLRTVKIAKGLRKLLFALTISIPALFNIGALLTLITFIYAILGMALFSKAPMNWSIDQVYNFQTFLNSNLILIRLMTVAGWNEVMDSLTVIEPVCGSYRFIKCGLHGEPECLNRAIVIAYIVSYILLTNQIMMKLFVAIILENYVEASDEEDVGIVEDDLEMFYIRWSKYDPYATQFISFEDLPDFLDSLNPPFQLMKPNTMIIVSFNLPIARGNKIHCLDILHALIAHVLGQVDDSPEFRKLKNGMDAKFQKLFPSRRLLEIVSSTRQWKIENNAAARIQRAWRKYRCLVKPKKQEQPVVDAKPRRESTSNAKGKVQHGGLGHMMNRIGNKSKNEKSKEKSD